MNTAATALQGSGRIVDDFSTFCEGDVEPTLNKTIHSIIDGGKDYIVYVDHDMSVEWSMSGSYGPSPTGFSEVANAVGHLETQSIGRLKPSQLEPFSRLCAEAIARVIGDHDLSAAREAVAGAEAFLEARSTENAKSWEVVAAMESAGVAIAGLVCFLLFRVQLTAVVGRDALDLSAGALFGAVGALLSILTRLKGLKVDAAAGPSIHRLEGCARIFAGLIGALVVALGVKSNMILGYTNSLSHPALALMAICAVSGGSERIVPSFIEQVEAASANRERKTLPADASEGQKTG